MEPEVVDVTPVAGMNLQTGLLLAQLDTGTQEWREELGEISDATVVWQPVPNGHSIGAILLHIADVEAYWLHEVAAGQTRSPEELSRLLSKETQQYAMQWPTPPAQPLAWYYAQHDAIRARTHQLLPQLDDPERVGTRRGQGFTLRWLLHHVLTHEAYHSGQAVLLSVMHKSGR